MSRATLLLLAWPRSAADRRRFGLVAVAVGLAAMLLLVALRIVRVTGDGDRPGLATYVTESGLRPGVVLGAALLVVPVLALLLQALRLGALDRDRRMAALRLAGASTRAVRAVAAAEVAAAAAAGGVVAGPAYVLLGLALRAFPSDQLHVVPSPDLVDLVVWPAVCLLVAAVGAAAGAAVEGRVVTGPLDVARRTRRRGPGLPSLAVLAGGLALVVLGFVNIAEPAGFGDAANLAAVGVGSLAIAFGGGPWLVRAASAGLLRAGGVRELLAGGRLAADLRGPGRAAGVLLLCGFALGIDLLIGADIVFSSDEYGSDSDFFLAGFGLAGAAILVAVVVSITTLVVGSAEGLHESRRPTAGIAALGADEGLLARVLRLQLCAIAVPPVVLGVLVAGMAPYMTSSWGDEGFPETYALIVLAAAAVAGALVVLAAALVTRGMRGRLHAAVDPGNLRAP